jgi:hypothetical protein
MEFTKSLCKDLQNEAHDDVVRKIADAVGESPGFVRKNLPSNELPLLCFNVIYDEINTANDLLSGILNSMAARVMEGGQ